MRAVASEIDPSKARVGARPGARSARLRKTRLRNLALESLEARELLATVPALVQDTTARTASLFSPPGTGSVSNTSIAIDPAHPNKMVAVWQRNDPSNPRPAAGGTSVTVPVFVQAAYSTNGGVNWSLLNNNLGSDTSDFTVTSAP